MITKFTPRDAVTCQLPIIAIRLAFLITAETQSERLSVPTPDPTVVITAVMHAIPHSITAGGGDSSLLQLNLELFKI